MKKRITKFILALASIIIAGQIHAQKIEFGQSAENIQGLIELSTKSHNRPDSYGNRANSHWTWDVKFNNGKIIDVIQCFQNQFSYDFKVNINYCVHYIMVDNKLSSILTQFENISMEKLIEQYNKNNTYNKIGDFYFSSNYEEYTKIYLSNSRLATTECCKTVVLNLPLNIQQRVKSMLELKRQEAIAENEKKQQEFEKKEQTEEYKRIFTILDCAAFSEGLSLVRVASGNHNYGAIKRSYGFINQNGGYEINPIFDKAFSFHNGIALVQKSSEWKFINKKGENVFNKTFSEARNFSEGLAAVRLEGENFGFIDTAGVFVVKQQYEEVGDFIEGFARVKSEKKWGYIDKTGKEFVIPQFCVANDYSEGLALVGKFINNKLTMYSYIDKTGNIAIQLEEGDEPPSKPSNSNENEIGGDFINGLAMINVSEKGNVFIDKTGEIVIKPKNKYLCYNFYFYPFVNNYSIVKVCSYYGFLNKKGKMEIEPIFDDVENFYEGLAKVKLNGNWGFIDTTGNVVINKDILKEKTEIQKNPPFEYVSSFYEGMAIVKVRGKYGYIDKIGNWLIEPIYLELGYFNNGIAKVKIDGREGWNFIDKTGKILFPHFL